MTYRMDETCIRNISVNEQYNEAHRMEVFCFETVDTL
jgi:hypothetical protein